MGLSIFTLIHILISLAGIVLGLVVAGGWLAGKQFKGWTAFFVVTTVTTSVTGFFFPFRGFTPAYGVGIISLFVLAAASYDLYLRRLSGVWSKVYVISREGFQKSYDLTARVLPENIDRSMPAEPEAADFLIERTLRAHGLAREPELRYLRDGAVAATIRKRLAHAVKQGRVNSVQVGDLDRPAYALLETLEQMPDSVEPIEARILSPFDNLIVQRDRLRWLFDFDYQLQSYVPLVKRRYGHFVLPVLWGERFSARLEAKALSERSKSVLTGLWFEPGYERNRKFRKALRAALSVLPRSTSVVSG